LSGIAAALLQAIIDPTSEIPMIGASGAIAGVLGAYLILYPRANVNVLFWLIIFITVIRIPAFIVLGVWIISQFFSASFTGDGAGVAYFAHIGGFIAGALLIAFFKDSHVKLFSQPQTEAFKTINLDMKDLVGSNKKTSFMDDFIKDSENKKRH